MTFQVFFVIDPCLDMNTAELKNKKWVRRVKIHLSPT